MTWILYPLITIGGGFFFYWLRQRYRLAYGACEIIAAVLIPYYTLFPPDQGILGNEGTAIQHLLFQVVFLLAGIYIMVQGLEDVRQGLPARFGEK